MDSKEVIKDFKKTSKKVSKKNKGKANYKWACLITVMAFVISFLLSLVSETVLPNANIVVGAILVIAFILLGVLFDMIGVAVTSANIEPFNAMSAKKIRGAALAVSFKKNASKVSSFCNDVIGDICGIISGSAGVVIASNIHRSCGISLILINLIITSLIAAFTIGGKAMGKNFAIIKSDIILYHFSRIISYVYCPKRKNYK